MQKRTASQVNSNGNDIRTSERARDNVSENFRTPSHSPERGSSTTSSDHGSALVSASQIPKIAVFDYHGL